MVKKNVILITVDCLRADYIHHLGSRNLTPNIDKLARSGVSFSNAFSNGANTSSSFPSIMSSTYPTSHIKQKIGDNIKRNPYWLFLNEEIMTIAELFNKNGYHTIGIHSNPYLISSFGYGRGFNDYTYLKEESFIKKDINVLYKFKYKWKQLITVFNIFSGRYFRTDGAKIINELAYEQIKTTTNIKQPFFIWLHYMDVHMPYLPPNLNMKERINALYLFKSMNNISKNSDENSDKIISLYIKSIKYFDDELGVFLDKLESLGINDNNTYFVLTADHGEQLMDHGYIGHGLLYDEVIRIPLILTGPNLKNNIINKNLVCHLDLAPTLSELCNIVIPPSFQGISLFNSLKTNDRVRDYVIAEDIEVKQYSYRTNEYKYAIYYDNNDDIIREELYNIIHDKKEKHNIKDDNKIMLFRTKILNHINKNNNKNNVTFNTDLNEEEESIIKERLKKLGYI